MHKAPRYFLSKYASAKKLALIYTSCKFLPCLRSVGINDRVNFKKSSGIGLRKAIR